MKISSFGKVVRGKEHKICEDAIFLGKRIKLFAVADGVTIPTGGKDAAEKSMKYLKKYWKGNLVETFEKINRKIIEDRTRNFIGYTTLTAVKIGEGIAEIANVGDSPAYLVYSGRIVPISATDKIFGTHALSQAIGEEKIEVHYSEEKIGSGNYILIISDGISDVLNKEEILDIFAKEKKPENITRRIMNLAEKKQTIYNDDKSIIVIQIL
jgi:serine/threonine protein phosphatase PrpC